MLVPEPPVMLVGATEQVSPVAGETLVVSAAVSVKPLIGVTVIVAVVGTPGVVVAIAGLANIWKSTTWTKIVVVCDNEPLVPMSMTI